MTQNIPFKFNPMPVYHLNGGSIEPPEPPTPPTPIDTTPLTFYGFSKISLTKTGNPDPINLRYSIDGGEWQDYTIGDELRPSVSSVAFSGNNDHFSKDYNNYYTFNINDWMSVSGNIQSLMNFSDTAPDYCYYHLFYWQWRLSNVPILPATTLGQNCYNNMFYYCVGLRDTPQSMLPATTLAPHCYSEMFKKCLFLSSTPALPATTLANYCYTAMFAECSALSTAPELPVTGLAESCYQSMFEGCTSLTDAPYLPATILAPACYYQMFYGCSSLSNISVNFSAWRDDIYATGAWVYNVAANGTFTCPVALDTTTRDNGHCPSGWTVVNK